MKSQPQSTSSSPVPVPVSMLPAAVHPQPAGVTNTFVTTTNLALFSPPPPPPPGPPQPPLLSSSSSSTNPHGGGISSSSAPSRPPGNHIHASSPLLPTPSITSYPTIPYQPLFRVLSPSLLPAAALIRPTLGAISNNGGLQLQQVVQPVQSPCMTSNVFHVCGDSISTACSPITTAMTMQSHAPHSRTNSESSTSHAGSSTTVEMMELNTVDVDVGRDSLSEGESTNGSSSNDVRESTGSIYLRAESPVILQDLITDSLRESEMEISTCFNTSTSTVVQNISKSNSGNQAMAARPGSGNVVMSTVEHPNTLFSSGRQHFTGMSQVFPSASLVKPSRSAGTASPLGTSNVISHQILPLISATPSIQRPATLPFISLSPAVLPLATPMLQYPFAAVSPYSILPSIIQTQHAATSSQQAAQYFFKLLPTNNTVSTATPSDLMSSSSILPPPLIRTAQDQTTTPTPTVDSIYNKSQPTAVSSSPKRQQTHDGAVLTPTSRTNVEEEEGTGNTISSTIQSRRLSSLTRSSSSRKNDEERGEFPSHHDHFEENNDNHHHSSMSSTPQSDGSGELLRTDESGINSSSILNMTNRSLHLWEFILHLLLTPNHGNIIQWTGENYEFSIIDPQGLTVTWSEVTGTKDLSFNGLLGILRSYSGLGILEPVEGKKMTYTFTMDVQKYMSIYGHHIVNLTKT